MPFWVRHAAGLVSRCPTTPWTAETSSWLLRSPPGIGGSRNRDPNPTPGSWTRSSSETSATPRWPWCSRSMTLSLKLFSNESQWPPSATISTGSGIYGVWFPVHSNGPHKLSFRTAIFKKCTHDINVQFAFSHPHATIFLDERHSLNLCYPFLWEGPGRNA